MTKNNETIAVRVGEAFDAHKVEHYLRAQIEELAIQPVDTMEIRQFPSGASNLTYLIKIGTWEGVLRRPPLGPVAPKAHDMGREASLLGQIHDTFSLAPRPYCLCTDTSIIGAPFYVMERRRGVILNESFPEGVKPDEELCRRISRAMVETLVSIHALDWRAASLEHFGHPEGFLARQVEGWIGRYQRAKTDDIPGLESLLLWLSSHVPSHTAASLIHNDFKLNNVLLDVDNLAHPVAVLDWEMATIGDPLFDLAITLSYWVRPTDAPELRAMLPTVTTSPGFYEQSEFMELYARRSGRDLEHMHFYMTFAYFKLAVILQQIYVRWKRGQTSDVRFQSFGERACQLIQHAYVLSQRSSLG
ncbi:phosphotransferase family protein [Ktedonospora formicarum]|uniref:Aminoglycoside phosphotransferase n=1 Tax=Ktedonospora formicarum TaxID=2778364 RepID=A0A8J3HZI1_9CHLR|nr:phosphotransferase family protein [Ktedonospora formicarum]GHO43368.1 aminoglycoside phosphotransferase [Ktedonospora formicarum]